MYTDVFLGKGEQVQGEDVEKDAHSNLRRDQHDERKGEVRGGRQGREEILYKWGGKGRGPGMGPSLVAREETLNTARHNPPSFFYSTLPLYLSKPNTLPLIRCAVCPSFPALLFSYPAAKGSIQIVPWPDLFPLNINNLMVPALLPLRKQRHACTCMMSTSFPAFSFA